jgi:cell wall-associated NlpC family hydrolase
MKKAVIILAIFLSLNIGGAEPNQVQAKEPATKSFNLNKALKQQQQKQRFPKVIKYLTTRVHKTSYVFSGSNTRGWDCSGMVRWAYQQIGITLPHSADKQGHLGKRVSEPVKGDIVVFAYQGSTSFNHAAIYLGDGLIINANREYGTTIIQPLSDFASNQIRFVRILN